MEPNIPAVLVRNEAGEPTHVTCGYCRHTFPITYGMRIGQPQCCECWRHYRLVNGQVEKIGHGPAGIG